MKCRKIRMSTKKEMMSEQKIYGIILILLSFIILSGASFFTVPLGVWLLFTKDLAIT